MLKAPDIQNLLQQVTSCRLGFEKRWYIVDRFLEGIHFERVAQYKEGEVHLLKPRFVKGVEPIPIPRADKQLDSILNILFANKPIWKIYPLSAEEGAIENAEKLSLFFDVLWDVLNIRRKIKRATASALKYNIGYLEVGVDFAGNLFIEDYAPWQIYHDVGIENLSQTRFLVKVLRKQIEELKQNKSYDEAAIKELHPEGKISPSDYFDIRFKEKFIKSVEFEGEENKEKNLVLVKEVWFKENGKWYLGTECQGKWLRQPQEAPYSLPFVPIQIYEGDVYQTSLIEKVIPLNKEIDLLTSYVKSFIYACGMGKFLEPKGAKIERIIDEQGERIRYEPGREPSVLQMPQLNPAIIEFLNLMTNYMDERGTAVLSFGKLPSKKLGWKAMESLKEIELGNMQGIIENITDTLKDLAYKILEVGEAVWTDNIYQIAYPQGILKVLSEQSFGLKPEFASPEIIPISPRWGIKVEIESSLSFTPEGQREAIKEYLQMGVMTPEEAREKLKLGPSPIKEAEKAAKIAQEKTKEEALPPEIQSLPKVGEIPLT